MKETRYELTLSYELNELDHASWNVDSDEGIQAFSDREDVISDITEDIRKFLEEHFACAPEEGDRANFRFELNASLGTIEE